MDFSAPYQPFPHTHWSLVRRAGQADAAARREALGVLLARYQPALRSYLRAVRGLSADAADDLLQAFIADQLLARELLQRADAARGRFRTLLLTSLNNFAVSRHRAAARRPADALEHDVEAAGGGPAVAVEAAWARALVNGVVEAMRRECAASGRADVWGVFEGRLLAAVFNDRPPLAYEDVAARYGLSSPAQAANLLVTAKRMYARLLRAAVGEYERDPAAVDDEIADLRRLLARGGTGPPPPPD